MNKKFRLVSKKIGYPLVTSIFFFLQILISSRSYEILHFMSFLFALTFSLLFSILFEGFMQYQTNKKSRMTVLHRVVSRTSTKARTVQYKKEGDQIKYIWLCLLGPLRFISDLFFRFFLNIYIQGYTMIVTLLALVLAWILSFLFFRNKLGRHCIVSIFILGVICVFECFYLSGDLLGLITATLGNLNIFAFMLAFFAFSLSLKEVIERHVMIKYFVSPYLLLFYEGIGSLICFCVLTILLNYCPCATFVNFVWLCKKNSWAEFTSNLFILFGYIGLNTVYVWSLIVVGIALNCLRINMNKELTSTHRYISDNMANFYIVIFQLFRAFFDTQMKVKQLIDLGVLMGVELFALIAYCIFNEHIILYFCKMEIDTKEEIERRAVEDQNLFENMNISLVNLIEEDNSLEN